MNVLLVEDNERVSQFVTRGMTQAGHAVDHASDGERALALAAARKYDVMIVDRMLPGEIDGLTVVARLRKAGNRVPILILSALADVDERIRGLQAGGDDYLVKPFAFGELLARVDALYRRSSDNQAATSLSLADLRMDLLARKVTRAGKPIALQPREFKLLEYLMRHANQVVSRTMLLEHVWEYRFDPQTNVIDVHVSKLRQKIDAGGAAPLLRTIRNVGYMLTDHA